MNAFTVICLLVSLPMAMSINCYSCSALTGGCNDPFDKTASGVTTTGVNSTDMFCRKWVVVGIVTRSSATSCMTTGFTLNSGTACCQTDLCNGARTNNQIFVILIISLVIILAQIQ